MKVFGPYTIHYRASARDWPPGEFPPLRVGRVEVLFDPVAAADYLGPAALRSKGRKARLGGGRIVVRVVE